MNRSKLNYSLFLLLFWRTVCWAFMSFHRSALLILPIMEKKDEENEKNCSTIFFLDENSTGYHGLFSVCNRRASIKCMKTELYSYIDISLARRHTNTVSCNRWVHIKTNKQKNPKDIMVERQWDSICIFIIISIIIHMHLPTLPKPKCHQCHPTQTCMLLCSRFQRMEQLKCYSHLFFFLHDNSPTSVLFCPILLPDVIRKKKHL